MSQNDNIPSRRKSRNGEPDPAKLLHKRQIREQSSNNRHDDIPISGMRITNTKNPSARNQTIKKGFRTMDELLKIKI